MERNVIERVWPICFIFLLYNEYGSMNITTLYPASSTLQ